MERLLHLDVECVARFAFVRGNCSKRVFAIKHTDIYPCTFAETSQRPCSYLYRNMHPHRVSNRLKTSLCGNKSKIPSSQLSVKAKLYIECPVPPCSIYGFCLQWSLFNLQCSLFYISGSCCLAYRVSSFLFFLP